MLERMEDAEEETVKAGGAGKIGKRLGTKLVRLEKAGRCWERL